MADGGTHEQLEGDLNYLAPRALRLRFPEITDAEEDSYFDELQALLDQHNEIRRDLLDQYMDQYEQDRERQHVEAPATPPRIECKRNIVAQ